MEQADLYTEYSRREQMKYGVEMLKPYLRPGLHVLDVGCGEGNLSMCALDIIGENGSLFGIDADKHRIQRAREKSKDKTNATFLCVKGSDIPMEKMCVFDVAICSTVMHLMDEQEKTATVNRVFKLLKPGGLFLIQYIETIPELGERLASFLGKEYQERLENHWFSISLDDFAKACTDSGFQMMHSESFEHDTSYESLGDIVKFYTAAWGGLVDFRKVEKKLADEGKEIPESWMINGAFHNIIPIHRLILRRPEN